MDTPTRILNKSNDFLPITYDERLQNAINEIEKQKEEEAKERRNKRTKSVSIVTMEAEVEKQKEKLKDLIKEAPMEEYMKKI